MTIDRDFPKPVVAYGAAVAAVVAALLLRLILAPWLGPTNQYLSFFPAILAASWFGGFGPGVAAAVLSSVASFVWILEPTGFLKLPPTQDLNALALFAVISIGIAYLSGAMRKAQAAESRAALEWRTTLASIGDAVIVTDRHGHVRFMNPVAERLTGWTLNEVLDRRLDDIFTAVDEDDTTRPVESPVAHVLREGRAIVLTSRTVLRHKQGRMRPIADSAAPVRNAAGEIDGVVLVFRDQTAERESTRELSRSRGLLQAMSDRTPAVTYVKDLQGKYLFVNKSFLELFHVTQDEILGHTDVDLFGAEIAERFMSMDRRVVQANVALTDEEVVPLEDGDRTYLSVKCPLWDEAGKPYAVFGVSTDISDRKRIESALLESRRHYQALAEALPHLVWTCRADGYCDYLSRQWVQYTGRSAEEQLGAGWADAIHPDDRARVEQEWGLAVERGHTYDEEFRLRRYDGTYRWFRTRGVPLLDASGTLVKWFGSNTDVEDYKRSEQRLRAQLERLDLFDRLTRAIGERQDLHGVLQVVVSSLEDHLPLDYCCVCLYDAADRMLTVECVGERGQPLAGALDLGEKAHVRVDNDGLAKCLRGLLVYEPDIQGAPTPFSQRLTRGAIRSFVGAPLVTESNVFGVLIAARRVPAGFSSTDCEFLRQLSEHVALAAHQAQLHTALQRAYDDLHQTQHAVMQQERLKALGQMASGIAHDINNAISPVALYTESLLETETSLSPRARDYLETIQRANEDVAATVARMREFYRPREAELVLSPVNLNDVAEDVIGLTRARWSDMPQERGVVIELDTSLTANAPVVPGVESELREALTNLVFNAVDAMPEGGTLSVRTRRTSDPSRDEAPDRVYIEVSDSGVGMDAETQRRCLEPFFTTKGERGTGLGLATVYGTVQRHGAEIYILSAPGRGTTVQLVFAASREAAVAPEPPRVQQLPQQRILVVDDDPLLLKSLRDTLEIDGHAVTTASGGLAGLEAFSAAREAQAPFNIVITDLGMPYVDGRQVAGGVKELSPSTPVILLTGWGQRLMDDGERPPHVDRVLNKPPKLADLRSALAALTTAAGT
ncbi:MAG TPA: PAS domain-containing protein [Vicinamibacterales bacterium]|nr:PAS domain-containing protein [Vicinamibacterales bacterium]